jgi:hypothetical protein
MFRAALLAVIAMCGMGVAAAQEDAPRAPYTVDEYVEARRPIISARTLSGEEHRQADALISTINTTIKAGQRVDYAVLDQLAPLAESGDRKLMKAMMQGYAGAGALQPWPADGDQFTSWSPGIKLAGLWAVEVWKAGDRSKETSKAIDNCWAKYQEDGRCGFLVRAKDDFNPVFNAHWAHGKGAPKDVVFTAYSLTPPPEKQKERFEKFVADTLAGEPYSAWQYIWAEVWAQRNGGDALQRLEAAAREGSKTRWSREAARIEDAKLEREKQIAEWEALQAKRRDAKAEGYKLSDSDEASWIQLSHILGGKYLVPFAAENVIIQWTVIDSLCREDAGPVCQRQKQLYQYRADAARAERDAREAALRNLTLGGGSVNVRTYDQSGNYLGTTSMPAWQADVIGAQ